MQALNSLNWFTTQELAGLPYLPGTAQNVRVKAKQENWPSRKRAGSKAMEYPFSCLPQATQAALLKKAVAQVTGAFAQASADKQGQALAVLAAAGKGLGLGLSDAPSPPAPLPQVGEGSDGGVGKKSGGKAKLPALRQAANDALSQRQILSRDARWLVVRGIEKLIKGQRLSVRAACQQLCDWVQAGEVEEQVLTALALGHSKSGLDWSITINQQGQPVAEALPGQAMVAKAKTVSRRTLERWVAASREGQAALAPQVRRKDMSIAPWMPLLLSKMNRPQKPTLAAAYREACREASQHGIAMPSYDTALHWYSHKFSAFDAKRGRHTGSALNPFKHANKRDSSDLKKSTRTAGLRILSRRIRSLGITSN